MADYTRLIEFKVKGTELTRATDKIFKSLSKIEISVEKTNKGLAVTAKQLKSVAKEANNTEKALNKIVRAFSKLKSPQGFAKSLVSGGFGALLNNPGKIAKLITKLGVADAAVRTLSGRTKGLGQTILDLGKRVLSTRKALEGYSQTLDKLIRQHPIATAQLIGFAGGLGAVATYTPQIYNLGKAFRQLTADIAAVDKAGRAGGLKNILRMFPSGSILGGIGRSGDISGLKFKDLEKEQKKIEKSAKKLAYNYKAAATGLAKLREQLDKSKRIQDKLLAGSDRYNQIARKTLSIEQQITKEEQKRANIKRRMTWGKDLMKLVTGRGGLAGKALDIAGKGVAGYGLADAGIRKLSGLLGKQVGLFQATGVAASKFWQTLQAVNQGAQNAAAGLTAYGRHVIDLITQHQRLIQVIGGLAGGLDAVGRFTPQIYAAGKAWRQLEYDIRRVGKAFADSGPRGVARLFPEGSMIGRWGDKKEAGEIPFDGKGAYKGIQKAWKGGGITSQIDGLNKVNTILERNKKIQENISAGTKTHVQAVAAVKQAQFAYNVELLKTKTVQAVVTADIWAAKKAWQGVIGVLKGATGLLGGLIGGAAKSKIGQAAGVIGISDAVKRLAQHIPFVSQAWKDNLQVFATWTQRVTEGLTAVTIAHGVFSKAIGAAQWTTGAISGLVRWEKAAMLTFHRINKARIDLDRDMARWLDKGAAGQRRNNPIRNVWDKLVGGRRTEIADIYNQRDPGKDTRMVRLERTLQKAKEALSQTDSSAAIYEQRQHRVIRLEKEMNNELNRRAAIYDRLIAKQYKSSSVFEGRIRANIEKSKAGREASGFIQRPLSAGDRLDYQIQGAYRRKNLRLAATGREQLQIKKFMTEEEKKAAALATKTLQIEKRKTVELRRAVRLKRLERKREAAQMRGRLMENLMLGAGFPLLFGGGAGAVGGGVLGAGIQAMTGSKGFGMQILFSAIGTAVDQFVAKTADVGKALNQSTRDLGALQTALGTAGTGMDIYLDLIRKSKGEYEAVNEAFKVLELKVGKEGAQALKDFGEAASQISSDWAIGILKVQATLASFLRWIGMIKPRDKDPLGLSYKQLLERANASTDPDMLALHLEGARDRQTMIESASGRMTLSGQQSQFQSGVNLKALNDRKVELQREKELENLKNMILQDQTKELRFQLRLKNATSAADVKRIENEKQIADFMKAYTDALTKAGFDIDPAKISKVREEIEKLIKALNPEKIDYIGDAMKQWKDRLDDLKDPAYQLVQAADAIGNAFSDAFKGIVSGSMTAGEAFAAFTRSVANHFLDMAAEIAATALKVGILKMFGGAVLGSVGSVGQSTNMGNISMGASGGTVVNSAGQGFGTYGPNYGIRQFAEGGYVGSPTNALIGDGGEGEYVIPESKMNAALANYAGGARGDSVVPSEGGEGESSGISGGGTRGSIDVSFNTQVINDVAYVSYAEFEAGVREAAAQGARMGESSTLKKLQNSSSVRRRVGV